MFELKLTEEGRGIFELIMGEILAIGGGISVATGNTLGAVVGLTSGATITANGVCRLTKGASAYRLICNKLTNTVNGVYLAI